ncbi:MAG: methyltransferase domain-containing protein [Vicingus serpentipes]|nr:methyltransferase domain-containing protein [Vicingus serpentipes]
MSSRKNKDNNEWFKEWFNSPYYHLLYKDRNHREAEDFIKNLFALLSPKKEAKILDIACGKGRHALQINKLGYTVDAFDLSQNSIKTAQSFENETLHFYVNDIRTPLKLNHYDYSFNLFTSFGYFFEEEDNYKAIQAIADSIIPGGTFVMDFMNTEKVLKELIPLERKIIDNITFNITRKVDNGFIVKNIEFVDKGQAYQYEEKVKALSLSNFKDYFNAAKLKLTTTFGDYNLSDFDIESSDRLIMIVKK